MHSHIYGGISRPTLTWREDCQSCPHMEEDLSDPKQLTDLVSGPAINWRVVGLVFTNQPTHLCDSTPALQGEPDSVPGRPLGCLPVSGSQGLQWAGGQGGGWQGWGPLLPALCQVNALPNMHQSSLDLRGDLRHSVDGWVLPLLCQEEGGHLARQGVAASKRDALTR